MTAAKAHRLPGKTTTTDRLRWPRPLGLHRPAATLCPATSVNARISDGLPGVSIWVGAAHLPGRRVVRLANGPLRVAVFVARRARRWDATSTRRPATG